MSTSSEDNFQPGEISYLPYEPWLPSVQQEDIFPTLFNNDLAFFNTTNPLIDENTVESQVQSPLVPPRPSVTRKRCCHVCSVRCSNDIPVAECQESSCGRVVCRLCFLRFRWNWTVVAEGNPGWRCVHCRGTCPAAAYCHVNGMNEGEREGTLSRYKNVT